MVCQRKVTFRGVCQEPSGGLPGPGRPPFPRETPGKENSGEGCWQTSGRSPWSRGVPEACLACVRKVPGRRPEGSWQTSGRFLADVRKMPRRPLWKASEKRWEDLGRPVADLWKMANETRAYRGIAAELPSGLPKAFLPLPTAVRCRSGMSGWSAREAFPGLPTAVRCRSRMCETRWEGVGRPLADLWKMADETRAYRGIAAELPSGLPKAFLPLPHCTCPPIWRSHHGSPAWEGMGRGAGRHGKG